MEQRATLKELAKTLNLSVSTVSKALNNSHEISTRTKERVKQLAVLNNYVPNSLAQSLKYQKTRTIGVIIPDVLAHFFAKALHGIEHTASSMGYKIIICISNESTEKESESINTFINGSVDGVIMSLARETQASNNYEHLMKLKHHNIPLVLFDRITDNFDCDKITINDHDIAGEATMDLLDSGRTNIIYLSTIFNTSVDRQRQAGYIKALKEAGKEPLIKHIFNKDEIGKDLAELLKQQQVDGILAADEFTAVSAMKTVINEGYRVPEDISFIGFTNGLMGENFIPSLTAVNQQAEDQGRLAVETIVNRIQDPNETKPTKTVIKTSIVHRGSTLQGEKV